MFLLHTNRFSSFRAPAADRRVIDSGYGIANLQHFHSGSYAVRVSDGANVVISPASEVEVSLPLGSDARLLNLSTRAQTITGSGPTIAGFVINGTGTKRLLLRGVGPALSSFGVSPVMGDPQLRLMRFDDGAGEFVEAAYNDDWSTVPDAAVLADEMERVGAFPLLNASADAALVVELPAGRYTAVVSDVNGGLGTAIVEIYDADEGPSTARLVNISTRGSWLIAGVVVAGTQPGNFLVRAIGPGLEEQGVANFAKQAQLLIFRSDSDASVPILTANPNWSTGPGAATTASISTQVGAFPLVEGSKDASFVVTLDPGIYTVQTVASGVALVEVYLVE